MLLLSAGTGGGHESVATAITEALAARAGSAVRVVTAHPLGTAVDHCYNWMLNRAPALWGACFAATNTALLHAASVSVGRAALEQVIARVRPDLILSVHALCARAASAALRRLPGAIPHHCVVTDLVDIHRAWSAPDVATFYVATEHAYQALRRAGVAAERLVLTGLPLRRPFWRGADRSFRAGADPLRVLLMDGGHPGPALRRALHVLLGVGVPLDIAIAWGGTCLSQAAPPHAASDCIVRTVPRQEIARHMAGADLLVTKAGSVTIAEGLAMGCPLVLHRAVPGQESSNPALLEAAGAGRYAPSPRLLARSVRLLGGDPEAVAAMAARAALLGRPDAALRVAEHLCRALDVGLRVQAPRAS